MATIATPWGRATALEEVVLQQRAGDRRFAAHVQLLETQTGDRLLRFAYATGGVGRRGPVTLRARDVEKLHALMERTPELKEVLLGHR